MPESERRPPIELPILRGDERFSLGPTVLDFWRWALGDLRMNTARGFLAEFLLATAVGSKAPVRVEWAAHDVDSEDGARLEVKSSGYLQSWTQTESSAPSYSFKSIRATRIWDRALGGYREVDPEDRVDAWVFALQTCQDPDTYARSILLSGSFASFPIASSSPAVRRAPSSISSSGSASNRSDSRI
jgi:hypothetical protein